MVRAQLDTGFIINLPFLAPWGLERMLQSLLHLVQKGLKFSEVALVAAHCLTGFNMIFFSIWVFFPEHSWIIGLEGNGEDISLTPHYHLHPLRRYLDISPAITAESSPLHIASSRIRTKRKSRTTKLRALAQEYTANPANEILLWNTANTTAGIYLLVEDGNKRNERRCKVHSNNW